MLLAALRCNVVEIVEIDGRDGDASAAMLRLLDRFAERAEERTRDRHAEMCIDEVIVSDIFWWLLLFPS